MNKIKSWIVVGIVLCLVVASFPFGSSALEDISAHSALLMTSDGDILFEKNSQEQLPIASTTKIMSAWLALESGDLDSYFTVDKDAIQVEGSSMGLKEGDQVTMRSLCYGMLLPSGNDAANAAAVRIAGSIDEFVKMMNERALQIGMTNTHFSTPSGLDKDVDHYSTAHDMALLAKEALKNPDFYTICSTYQAYVEYGNPPYRRYMTNHNKLLKQYPGAIGVKTGFTKKAGRCLVSAAERNGVRLISVVLNDGNDWEDSKQLLDYGFSLPNPVHLNVDFSKISCHVVGSNEESCHIEAEEEPVVSLTQDQAQKVQMEVYLNPFYYAPVKKGDRLGEAVYLLDGVKIASTDLISADELPLKSAGKSSGFWNKFEEIFINLGRSLLSGRTV